MKKLMMILGLFLSFNLLADHHHANPEYFSYSMSISGANTKMSATAKNRGWYVKRNKSKKMMMDSVTGMKIFATGGKNFELDKNLPFQKKMGMYSVTIERTPNRHYKMTMKYGKTYEMVRYLSLSSPNYMTAKFMHGGKKINTSFVFYFKDMNMKTIK